MNISLTLSLSIIGSEDNPRWAAALCPDFYIRRQWSYCCEDGHRTPEEAAGHGSELAARQLAGAARKLEPPQYGALVIRKLEAV